MASSAGNNLSVAGALERVEALLDGMASGFRDEAGCLVIDLEGDNLVEAARRLRDDETLSCKYFSHVAGIDNMDHMQSVYVLRSVEHPVAVELRVKLDRNDPVVPSVTQIWSGANFHEREAYDLFGIRFEGHPDLRRILSREDMEVFPCRKDAQPHREARPEWKWEGMPPFKRLPEEPPRSDRA